MRLPYPIILLTLIVSTISQTASAQQYPQGCYSYAQFQQCVVPGRSCSRQVYQAVPVETGYWYFWIESSCCGGVIFLPQVNQGLCLSAELRTPDIQKHLFEHAQKTEVLVASCDGYMRRLPRVFITDKPIPPKPVLGTLDGQRIYVPGLSEPAKGQTR
jgi:hypothetical protein